MWLWKVNMEPLHSVPTLDAILKLRYTSFPVTTAANQSCSLQHRVLHLDYVISGEIVVELFLLADSVWSLPLVQLKRWR